MRHDDPRRPLLIAMLVAGDRPGKIAAHFGVMVETLRDWRNDPDVKAEVERARNEIVGEALGKMKALAGELPAALAEALQLARASKDPYAIKAVVETIADRAGLTKSTRLDLKVEDVSDIDGWVARQRERHAIAAAPQLGSQEPDEGSS